MSTRTGDFLSSSLDMMRDYARLGRSSAASRITQPCQAAPSDTIVCAEHYRERPQGLPTKSKCAGVATMAIKSS